MSRSSQCGTRRPDGHSSTSRTPGHQPRCCFLDGVEAGAADGTLLVFDFGDLDQLVTHVDDQGNGIEVYLRA
jgi:hypothetical protein